LIALFILDKVSSLFTYSGIGFISRVTTTCFACMKVDTKTAAYAENILVEIDPVELEQEYQNTKLIA
jgi:hypothetical protein